MFDKLVLVTRKTRLQGLVERFNTHAQAKFYLEHAGLDFADYAAEDDTYRRSIDTLDRALDLGLPVQRLDRSLLATYRFGPSDLVIAAGQDGLVANTAKYIGAQPLIGVNPDPARFDGTLLPFSVPAARMAVANTLTESSPIAEVTLAKAMTSDGQTLLAFNDFFIGETSHQSAHYRLGVIGGEQKVKYSKHTGRALTEAAAERQSSSGVIVSTGAGSTGWLSSVRTMAERVGQFFGSPRIKPIEMEWNDPRLFYVVREPFVSKHSSATKVIGWLGPSQSLEIESLMPQTGTIFSDGMEADCLRFTSGMTVTISAAPQRARLVLDRSNARTRIEPARRKSC